MIHFFFSQKLTNFPRKHKELHRFYRFCQVYHAAFMDLIGYHLPFTIIGAEILLVTTAFSIIRLYRFLDPLFVGTLVSIGLFTLIVFNAVFQFAGRLTEASNQFSNVQNVQETTRDEKLSLLSCTPLNVKIHVLIITKLTFPTIVKDVVINSVVNLLLIFRKYQRWKTLRRNKNKLNLKRQ